MDMILVPALVIIVCVSGLGIFLNRRLTNRIVAKQQALPEEYAACRKQLKSLREREQKYRSYFECVPGAILLFEPSGKLLDANSAACTLTGYSKNELLQHAVYDFLALENREIRQKQFQQMISDGEGSYRTKIQGKQTGEYDIHLEIAKISENEYIGFCKNITERKQVEGQLIESKKRYKSLYSMMRLMCDNAPDLIWAKDLEKKFIFANKAICKTLLHAKDSDEPIGKNDLFFANRERQMYPEDSQWHTFGEICVDSDAIVLQNKRPQRFDEFGNVRGKMLYLDVYKAPFWDEHGNLIGTVGCGRVVTKEKQLEEERKQAEEALRLAHKDLERQVKRRTAQLSKANKELAKASRLKDEFLANMSHELRTPLNSILGMSEALNEEIYGELNEKQKRSLQTIRESGRHLLLLINDMLDLSRIGAGKLKLDIVPVSVLPLCQSSLQCVEPLAQKKHIHISFSYDNCIKSISADGRCVKQMLVKLLSNAIKFTPGGNTIGLDVEGDAEHRIIRFTVWDTGIGIASKDIEELFQPFVQLDSKLSRKYHGIGLGLSLVARMADMHGGSVAVESEEGKGSRFMILLPWEEHDFTIPETASAPAGFEFESLVPRKERKPAINQKIRPLVLVVDDNELTLKNCSRFLSNKGFRLVLAGNGWEAFAQTREAHPDLILMDIRMPEMDGLEAIRHIRSDKKGQAIPIIAVTSLAIPGDREKCLSAGANEYLIKPVSLKELSQSILRLLHHTDS